MNKAQAANILGLTGIVTANQVTKAYRKQAAKYHPDRNPAGQETMKMINAAYEVLKGLEGELDLDSDQQGNDNYLDSVNEALNAVVGLEGLNVEVCGTWVWLSGNTKAHKEVIKSAGFRWASKRKMWYFRDESQKRCRYGANMSMDDIRAKYGSHQPTANERPQIQPSL